VKKIAFIVILIAVVVAMVFGSLSLASAAPAGKPTPTPPPTPTPQPTSGPVYMETVMDRIYVTGNNSGMIEEQRYGTINNPIVRHVSLTLFWDDIDGPPYGLEIWANGLGVSAKIFSASAAEYYAHLEFDTYYWYILCSDYTAPAAHVNWNATVTYFKP